MNRFKFESKDQDSARNRDQSYSHGIGLGTSCFFSLPLVPKVQTAERQKVSLTPALHSTKNMISRSLLSSIKNSHLQNFPPLSFHPITTKNPTLKPLSFSSPFSTHHQPTPTSPPLFKLTHKDWLSPTEVLKIFDNLKEPNSLISVLNQYSTRKDYKPTEPLFTLVINKLADAQDFDSIQNIMVKLKHEKACRLSDNFFQNVIKKMGMLAVELKGQFRPFLICLNTGFGLVLRPLISY